MTDDLSAARAYLDHEKWWAGLTDDQRAELSRRRSILGSLDETAALNRSERGFGTLAAAIYIALPMGAIWAIYLGHPVVAAVLCYVTVAMSVALLLGHMMRRDELGIDPASLPLAERIAADQAPYLISETEAYLREVSR
jgi:hypothetical protein